MATREIRIICAYDRDGALWTDSPVVLIDDVVTKCDLELTYRQDAGPLVVEGVKLKVKT